MIPKDMHTMTKIQKYQHFLRRRFQEFENAYYPLTDALQQKLASIHGITPPDLDINQFPFIQDWQDGELSSEQVYKLLKTFNMKNVAETQLLRRMKNFLLKNPIKVVENQIVPCSALIETNAMPAYVSYLNLLLKYFEKLAEVDAGQIKMTWIEQMYHPGGTITKKIDDLYLNQVIRQLESQVLPFNSMKYIIGDNILCLDEECAKDTSAIHWICGPKCYIEGLQETFNVVQTIDIAKETDYIKRIIGEYL